MDLPLRMSYFKELQSLLKTEKEEDKKIYEQLIHSSTVIDRRSNGLSWYPVAIRGSEMSRGDYLAVEIERTTHQDITHQLRFGMPAALFSGHDAKENRAEGIITHINGNNLKLTLNTDELPDWSGDGKLGIDLLFDDNSYDEMFAALKTAEALSDKQKDGHLVRVLTGLDKPGFDQRAEQVRITGLNPTQQIAVHRILAAEDLAIVHGPPGTGKTTTVVAAIGEMIRREGKQILVSAPSNIAVDLLCEKLAAQGLNVLRIGNPVRVSEHLMSLTLENRVAQHPSMKTVKSLKKRANEFRTLAHKYKRNFGKAEREQRQALFSEAKKLMREVEETEKYVTNDIISRAEVIASTLVGANHSSIRHLQFDTAVIDEAGQSLEPASWIPVVKARKLILAGDHFQLPPTVKSAEAARKGLSVTLLEKAVALHPEAVVLLEEQYRMNSKIMEYSSRVFYDGKLRAADGVGEWLVFEEDEPLLFIDTAGCGFDEKLDGTSSTNPEEAAFLLKHLSKYVDEVSGRTAPEEFPSIAVISPYKQQVELLKSLFEHSPDLVALRRKIAVNTIDSFQGSERDVVYISMTRSNNENVIGFLADIRRMNVAMTRARKKLVVIGDSATLSVSPFYLNFIKYAESSDSYKSAWEFMGD